MNCIFKANETVEDFAIQKGAKSVVLHGACDSEQGHPLVEEMLELLAGIRYVEGLVCNSSKYDIAGFR